MEEYGKTLFNKRMTHAFGDNLEEITKNYPEVPKDINKKTALDHWLWSMTPPKKHLELLSEGNFKQNALISYQELLKKRSNK